MTLALPALQGLPLFDTGRLCDDLVARHWSVTRLGDGELLAALRAEAASLHEDAALTPAGIGRADDHDIVRTIRRDKTKWMDGSTPAQAGYLAFAEGIRQAVNRELMLGLFGFEAHFAVYEPGAFYKRHVDSFRGARNRVLSSVLYLNPDWVPSDGGQLAIFGEDGAELACVEPEFGTLAVFLSEEVPHEVRLSHRTRYSIAGWHRCNDRGAVPALQVKGLPVAP